MATKRYEGLSWVRLYTDAPRHEKVLKLMSKPKGREAWGIYCLALAWSGDQLTDGYVPDYALAAMHANTSHAALLEQAGLWERNGAGWYIHNFGKRQETVESLREARRKKRRAICERWQRQGKHPVGCRCWEDDERLSGGTP